MSEDLKNLGMEEGIKGETDTLGGFAVQESGIYTSLIELAFLSISAGKAMALNLYLKMADSGAVVRQQFWVRSGEAKGMKNYYEKDGEKFYLPGFNMAQALCQMCAGKNFADMTSEEKIIKLYSFDAGGEVDTKVDMLTELLGKSVKIGLIKQTVNKRAKNSTSGNYEPTAELKDENEIDKLFHAESGKTISEAKAGSEALFIEKWDAKWSGQTKDKTVPVAGGTPAATVPTQAAGDSAPNTSLFK